MAARAATTKERRAADKWDGPQAEPEDPWTEDFHKRTQPMRILFELVQHNQHLAVIHGDLKFLALCIAALLLLILWRVW